MKTFDTLTNKLKVVPGEQAMRKREGDPVELDPSALREAAAFPHGHLVLRLGSRMVAIPKEYLIVGIAFLLVFYLLGAFTRWGFDSPLRNHSRNNGLVSSFRVEHEMIRKRQDVTNYILAECLAKINDPQRDCPRFPKPELLLPSRAPGE